ncbi:MAG: tetratricopeptide repeat protein [Bacteroidales bacterium]|jgi:tetratricopeptide (TPR) repeat protein
MKIKRIILIVALLAFGLSATAQTMKVQSAYADMKANRLAQAMENINDACINENTKADPKTWHYAGLIYAKLVEISQSEKSEDQKLWKKQKVETSIPELAEKAKIAFLKSNELEKTTNTNEYTTLNNGTLNFIVRYQLSNALNVFNSGKYAESIPMFEDIVITSKTIGKNASDVEMKARFCIAMAYDVTKQKDKAVEMYRELINDNTQEESVYINLFIANTQAKEMDKAINVLKRGVKNLPTNYKLLGLLSGAYIEAGKKEEADKCIGILKNMADTITTNKQVVIVMVGDALRDGGNKDEAIAMYNKSLALQPEQTEANFGLGVLYFNSAVDMKEKADKLPLDQTTEYDKLQAESKAQFALSIPFFEKVLTMKPKDIKTLNALKVIYSRLEMTDKYKQVSATLESLRSK